MKSSAASTSSCHGVAVDAFMTMITRHRWQEESNSKLGGWPKGRKRKLKIVLARANVRPKEQG